METHELSEAVEKSVELGQRWIGLSMAIFAVLLAVATMLSHRAHTEEVLLETKATDQWTYYQAKDIRSHVYEMTSGLATLFGPQGVPLAEKFRSQGVSQRNDAEKIRKVAEGLDKEVDVYTQRALFYDRSELLLEVAIVLCSISLLSRSLIYWKTSFIFSAGGLVLVLWGLLKIH